MRIDRDGQLRVVALAVAALVGAGTAAVLLASPAQNSTTENVEMFGAWQVLDSVDLISDAVDVIATTRSDQKDATLAVVCRASGSFEILAAFDHEYTGSENRQIIYRVDRHEPITKRLPVIFTGSMSRLDWEPALAQGGDGVRLVEQARGGQRIIVRTYDSSNMPITRIFSLSGFSAATQRVMNACDYEAKAARTAAQVEAEAAQAEAARMDTTAGSPSSGTAHFNDLPMIFLYDAPGGGSVSRRGASGDAVTIRRQSEASVMWYLVELPDGFLGWVPGSVITIDE